MSVRSAIGSLLTVGIPGPILDPATRATLEELHVGGVILFRRNVDVVVEQTTALIAELHALPSAPLVSIDHEGGRVMRFGEPFTHFPPAAVIGRTADPQIAEQVGLAMAQELGSIGIDLSYAPVLDVHSNPNNPVIGDRSFGAEPELVAQMAIAQMRGLRAGGMIPCGKHFPGHGDTSTDSHHELPVVHRSRAELKRIELAPFRAAIAAGVPMLLTAHVIYTAFDAGRPATLSPLIIGGLLRDICGFRGVVATDDLEMGAITRHQSIGAAAVAALLAGVDMLLICQDLSKAVEASAAIGKALDDGVLSAHQINQAAQRVATLRSLRRSDLVTCMLPDANHRALAEQLRSA